MGLHFGTGKRIYRTASLPSATAFTISGWGKRTATTGTYAYFAGLENVLTGASSYALIGWANTDTMEVTGSSANASFASKPADNTWFFWYLRQNATNLQGGWATSGATFVQASAGASSFTPGVLDIGNDGYDEFNNLAIAYVKVWDAVLTDAELYQEMYSVIPRRYSNLHLWSPLWGPSDVRDLSGNGKDFTVSATAPTQDDAPPISWITSAWLLPFVVAGTPATLSINVSDTVTLSETVSRTIVDNVSVSDAITLSETVSRTIAYNASVSDTVTLSETVSCAVSAPIINASDTVTVGESITVTLVTSALTVNVSDTVTLSESVNCLIVSSVSVSDTITLSESVQRTLVSNISKSETVTLSETYRVIPLINACINGVLTVNGTNSRYFQNNNGIIVLTGFHTWYDSQDGGATDPPPAFDYAAWLDYNDARGTNFFKLWNMETAREWPDVHPQYYSPPIYKRTGPGNAADGKLKFDLDQLNQEYFDRLRQRVAWAGSRGYYVCIQLFQGWQIDQKGVGSGDPWAYHPMNSANNINSINGDVDGDGIGDDTRNESVTAIFNYQKAYIRKVIDTLNDLDNVFFEISNEDGTYSVTWQHDLIDYIHTYESGLAKQHPVGMTWIWPGGNNASDLDASNAEWVSYGANDSTPLSDPPVATGSKVSTWDTDHMGGLVYDPLYVWRGFTRGHNPWYMDEYDGTLFGTDYRSDTAVEKIRHNLGYIQTYAAKMDLAHMTPQGSLASTTYCLAKTSGSKHEYIAYQPTSGSFTLDVSGTGGVLTIEWLRTGTGTIQSGGTVNGGATRTLTPPWSSEDVVVYLWQSTYTISVSDTVTLTESKTVSISGAFSINVSDAITLTETPSVLLTGLISVSDSVALTETVNRLIVSLVAVSDAVSLTETVNALLSSLVAVADSITLTESVTLATAALQVSISDSVTVTESVATQVDSFVAVSDAATVSESQTLAVTTTVSANDTVTLTEQSNALLSSLVSTADAITVTEQVIAQLSTEISVSDLITLGETFNVSLPGVTPWQINVSDLVTLGETVGLVALTSISVSEAITLAEQTALLVQALVSVSDTLDLTEQVSALQVSLVNVSSTLTLSETVTLTPTTNISVNESISLLEAITASVSTELQVSDAITLAETLTVTVSAVGQVVISVSDSIAITETLALLVSVQISVSDSVTTGDTATIAVSSADVTAVSVSDSVTVTETVTLFIQTSINVSDTATITESIARLATSFINVSDTVTSSEAVSVAVAPLGVNVSDAITVSENIAMRGPDLRLSVGDTLTITEIIVMLAQTGIIGDWTISDSATTRITATNAALFFWEVQDSSRG